MALANVQRVVALRRELALEERLLRESAESEARGLAQMEQIAWRQAQDDCAAFDRIRLGMSARLEAIRDGDGERFAGERAIAEMALRDADRADAAYTVISFANLTDRLCFLRGGNDRQAAVSAALERGGVYTEACRGRHFQGIVR